MKEARKDKGLTQGQLAAKVGCSQANISEIENGAVISSWLVVPISKLLGIAAPQTAVASESDQRWIDSGRRLAALSPSTFESILAAAERLADAEESANKPKKK
jgi:transcriptional regulator with XRE-family HTH domain